MSVTLTHTRKRLGRCGGRAGYRARAPRRIRKGNRDEKKRSKNESRRPSFRVPTQHDDDYFTREGADSYPGRGMHSTARRSTTTTTSHARGPIHIRLTSRRDRETTHAVANQRGTRGAARRCFFHRARRRFRLSRYFQGCRRPVKRLRRRHAHMHTHTRDVRRGRASSTARSFNFRQAETPRAFGRASLNVAIDGYR